MTSLPLCCDSNKPRERLQLCCAASCTASNVQLSAQSKPTISCISLSFFVLSALQLYGYFYSLGRYGLMATALLDMSNTLLHTAKALNYAEPALPGLAGVKDLAFKAFAMTFFLCRVLMPPFALIKPGLEDGKQMPVTSYYITNGLLLAIYSLQLLWFTKIVKIAMGLDNGDDEPSSKKNKVAAAAAGESRAKGE